MLILQVYCKITSIKHKVQYTIHLLHLSLTTVYYIRMAYRIFIVEDDDFLRSLAVGKLEKEGFVVETASNGSDGLTRILETPPELLILDLMLPEMSGFEVLEKIRSTDTVKNLKVVVFSNLGEETDIKRCLELGVSEYLIKANFTLDELAEKVKSLL